MDDVKYLFVYGTLMKEGALNLFLKGGFDFVGEAILKNGRLYEHDHLPIIISGKENVIGEVYEIKKPFRLSILDKIERNYNRIVSDVEMKDESIKAFAYFYKYPALVKNNPRFVKIESGDWKNK